MELPCKDKDGMSYLSYSQISCFIKSREQYYKTYILKEPFIGNEYTEFGNKVGIALQSNDFSEFTEPEKNILSKVKRHDVFERKTILRYDGFYVIGYIDSCSEDLTHIIDYKTGGAKKEHEYIKDEYTQLVYYALSIKQETGVVPQKANVEFIRRKGNLYRGEKLMVANEHPISINIDISEKRLRQVYWNTIKIAESISKYYNEMLHN